MKLNLKKSIGLMFLCCMTTLSAFAQNVTVKGVVTDQNGETVIGATVAVQNTSIGTVTDIDGAYSLSVDPSATLEFSCMGYTSQLVPVKGRTNIDVVLGDDAQALDAIVVIGYGSARRADVTGSIATMGGDNLREVASGDFTRALSGRIAGVTMTQTNSKPGASMEIRIRGQRSLSASNDPLIVLDGVPFMGSLSDIATSDIKSMDILKDASSTAIYGSRGANGVILITTYKGVAGQEAKVTFNNYIGFKNAIVARDYPEDDPTFDPDDIRYSCIRYSATREENAMGPSWTDPRTGEILQGSVYFYHDVLKLLHNWAFIQLSAVEPATRKEVFDVETMGPFLRYLIVHEVGHTLGLMHNMRGSYAYPVESLRDPEFTAEYGTTASIMDYARYNYVAQPGDGVEWLLPPRLGLYDKFAIAWGYKPIAGAKTPEDELPTLNQWLLEKDDDPIYQYGEQEFLTSIDPAAQTESLGDDAVKASEYGIRNLKIIAENLVDWTARDGKDYRYTKEMYTEILKQFNRYMGHVTKYIGGNFIQNAVHGDGKKGYIPVDKAKQKEALNFVYSNVRGLSDWMLDPKVMGQFSPGNDQIYDYQGTYVKSLLSAATKVAYTAKMSEVPYTQYEYLHDVYNLVFAKSMARKKLERSDMVMEYSFLYSVLEMLDMLNASAKKVAVADIETMFTEDLLPCSFYGLSEYEHNHEHELASAKKEADIKITGKAIYFELLSDMQKLMVSRSKSSNGEMKSHYSYLAFEINHVMKQL